nr:imidazole glycerol phosphate synthase hisHF, chloroplastic-like [Ipomoea batatas]
MEAEAFTSASQLGIAGKSSSSSSSSAGYRSLHFLQNKPNSIDLNFKPSRSSIRASGEEDSDPRLCYWRGGFRGKFARLWRWKCPESQECNSVSRL